MAYERHGASPLDYQLCRYGTSKLRFRGPARRLSGRYVAFLGGSETFGKFVERPFPALIEARSGARCVNFGWPNAGVDVFLNDPVILKAASAAGVTVVQVPGAQNMSNRFYTVHPRRNDRFVQASAMLRGVFRDVDFTEFHFTRHMLHRLQDVSPERFDLIRDELQRVWRARMRLLLARIEGPVVLLWVSTHAPGACADTPDLDADPAFVTRDMFHDLRSRAQALVEVVASPAAREEGSIGMVFDPVEAAAAAELPGPAAHEEVASALEPVISRILG